MKVAFVLGTSAGGLGRHVRMLAAGCAAHGVTVEVFGPARTDRDFGFSRARGSAPDSADPGTAEPFAVTFAAVEIADRPRVLGDLRAIARLRRLLRVGPEPPDVVHAHGLRAGALAAIAIAFGRVPARLVVTVHNAPPGGGATGAIYRVLELIVARTADSVLCVSADLEQRMRAARARRVGHAVVPAPLVALTWPLASPVRPTPPAAVRPTPPAPSADVSAETGHAIAPDVSAETRASIRAELGDGPIVLAAGRLAAQKGFGVLLDAAARWRDLRPEPRLVIVGEGPLDAELRGRAASLGLAVTFTGPRRDVPALLAAADVFVLPSAWEGQPLILQEALRAGVPIVATRVGGNPDLLGEDAAVLVPPGDAPRLADAVRSVLADPALAARLRLAALDRARLLPTEDDAVAAALAEYRRVAALPGAEDHLRRWREMTRLLDHPCARPPVDVRLGPAVSARGTAGEPVLVDPVDDGESGRAARADRLDAAEAVRGQLPCVGDVMRPVEQVDDAAVAIVARLLHKLDAVQGPAGPV